MFDEVTKSIQSIALAVCIKTAINESLLIMIGSFLWERIQILISSKNVDVYKKVEQIDLVNEYQNPIHKCL